MSLVTYSFIFPSLFFFLVFLILFANREIILPGHCYKRVLESIEEQNYLDFLADLEQKLRIEHVSQHVISLAMARRRLLPDLSQLADREVAMLTGCTVFPSCPRGACLG